MKECALTADYQVRSTMITVTKEAIIKGFEEAGVKQGDTLFVHSALRTFGAVEGGAETVVTAMVEAVGTTGTIVVPTFTSKHKREQDLVIDPQNDASEMGAISERVRTMPKAKRSIAYRHSVAAIGKHAEGITSANSEVSAFDMEGVFGKMLAFDTKVLFLGTTYETSTSHHFAEYLLAVPYRHTVPLTIKVRMPDGSVNEQNMTDYTPKPTVAGDDYYRGTDFNKLGRMLEDKGLVKTTFIGNAAVRLFKLKDLIELATEKYSIDPNIFLVLEGQKELTPLSEGVLVRSKEKVDGTKRPHSAIWSVVDPNNVYK